MTLAFILGREPHLSVAELFAVLGDAADWEHAELSREAMVMPFLPLQLGGGDQEGVEREQQPLRQQRGTNSTTPSHSPSQAEGEKQARVLISRLAGTVKIAEVTPQASSRAAESTSKANCLASRGTRRERRCRSESASETAEPRASRGIPPTEEIGQYILDHTNAEQRVRFGYSVYDLGGGTKEVQRVRAALTRGAKGQKAWLEEHGRKVRHVTSRDAQLSSVTVERQGLLPEDNGVEVCVLVGRTPSPPQQRVAKHTDGRPSNLQQPSQGGVMITLARTLAVQPFQEWSARDYGRPRRDARSGMLPPKLARMMCNIALARSTKLKIQHSVFDLDSSFVIRHSSCTLLDPFCGSGTILTEALLLGVPRVIGTDVSEDAVRDARENLEWMRSGVRRSGDLSAFGGSAAGGQVSNSDGGLKPAATPTVTTMQCDARQLSRCVQEQVDTIVTEPYLGPPTVSSRAKRGLLGMTQGLRTLYLAAFREFAKVLKPNGRVVFVIPTFRLPTRDSRLATPLAIASDVAPLGFTPSNPFPPALRDHPVLRGRDDLPYARADQRVGRRILTFTFSPPTVGGAQRS